MGITGIDAAEVEPSGTLTAAAGKTWEASA